MSEAEQDGEGYDFAGAMIKNADRITERKSIVICGVTRGGTSFAGSVFGNLGVPYSLPGERKVGRRYEHRELRKAFVDHDGTAIEEISNRFASAYSSWAWKLPAIQRDFEFVASRVPNPHFVLIFKEPVSVAARKTDLKGKEPLTAMRQVLLVYERLVAFAEEKELPVMLISYDRAMSRMEDFLPEAARFAGISSFDVQKIIAGIREDGARYDRQRDVEPVPNAVPSGAQPPAAPVDPELSDAAASTVPS